MWTLCRGMPYCPHSVGLRGVDLGRTPGTSHRREIYDVRAFQMEVQRSSRWSLMLNPDVRPQRQLAARRKRVRRSRALIPPGSAPNTAPSPRNTTSMVGAASRLGPESSGSRLQPVPA